MATNISLSDTDLLGLAKWNWERRRKRRSLEILNDGLDEFLLIESWDWRHTQADFHALDQEAQGFLRERIQDAIGGLEYLLHNIDAALALEQVEEREH